jgi:hypothetical protein
MTLGEIKVGVPEKDSARFGTVRPVGTFTWCVFQRDCETTDDTEEANDLTE